MKHLKKFATDTAVLSVGILAGVQIAMPLWTQGDTADVTAMFTGAAGWTAQLSSAGPTALPQLQPIGVNPRLDEVLGAPSQAPSQSALVRKPMGDATTVGIPQAAPAMPVMQEAPAADLQRQLADAQATILSLQQQIQMLQQQLSQSQQMVPAAPVSIPSQADIPHGAAPEQPTPFVNNGPAMAAPISDLGADAPASGILCSLFGLGC
jgi:hypothetical protein